MITTLTESGSVPVSECIKMKSMLSLSSVGMNKLIAVQLTE